MKSLSMEYLERCFKRAQDFNKRFIAVKIEMEEFPEPEVIINPVVNVENKLAYYKRTYDEKLNHKHAAGIKIIDFTFGDSMKDIEEIFFY